MREWNYMFKYARRALSNIIYQRLRLRTVKHDADREPSPTSPSHAGPSTKPFLSLKWRVLLLLGTVILITNAAYFVFQYRQINDRFIKDRESIGTRNELLLQSIINQQSNNLQHFGSTLADVYGLYNSLEQNDWATIGNRLHASWPVIQAEYGIEGVWFYDHQGKLVFDPSLDPLHAVSGKRLARALETSVQESRPVSIFMCNRTCQHVSVVPFLSHNSQVAAIAVYASVAEIIVDFSNLTSADIGILLDGDRGALTARQIPAWNSTIAAISNSNSNVEIIKYLSQNTSLGALHKSTHVFKDKTVETRTLPLDDILPNSDGTVVLLDDISEQTAQLTAITRQSLIIAGVGFIASELILYFILSAALRRLKNMSDVLPLLAKGEFSPARKALMQQTVYHKKRNDEVDLVNQSAITLANRLETLNFEIAAYTKSLASNMDELRVERDFIKHLLDTAQIIVASHSADGKLAQLNRYGLQLLGMRENEYMHQEFSTLFSSEIEHADFSRGIRDIQQAKLQHVRNESTCSSIHGIKSIAWIHSSLRYQGSNAGTVLSVGLDISERKEAERRIAWLANHDPLTGLYNRRYFNELFEGILRENERYGNSGALLFLDMDNFKYINDTQGHNAGDRLIEEVAGALRRITRESDVVARLGGDEFAIVIKGADDATTIDFCRDLNRRINAVVRPKVRGTHAISISIGIALYPQHGKSVQELLANADIAMYQAKESKKGGWHLFSPNEQAREKIQHQINWKEKIESAISNDRFVLHFQPILNILESKITHYEVLLRMREPNGTLLTPHSFIEIAENNGLIHVIDQIVVAKTLNILRAMGARAKNTKFSINLSAYSFSDRKILPIMEKLISAEGVPRKNLIFEITETAALQDLSAACDLIDGLQKLGCHFAIDDFGAGFSSFYYLKELPVDYVKIDGSFIQQLSKNPDDQLIVRAMSEIAQGFGKKTIAEYVEDEATFALLKKYKVDYAQGFFIGKPREQRVMEAEYAA